MGEGTYSVPSLGDHKFYKVMVMHGLFAGTLFMSNPGKLAMLYSSKTRYIQ